MLCKAQESGIVIQGAILDTMTPEARIDNSAQSDSTIEGRYDAMWFD